MATRTRSAERTQFLDDIMSTAIEGGVGYWSIAGDIEYGVPLEDHYKAYTLYCHDGEQDEETWEKLPGECGLSTEEAPIPVCPGHKVDREVVAKGMGLATLTEEKGNERAIGWHYSQRKHVIGANRENDGGDIDSGDADCIVQLGIFGKVIYG